MSLRAIILTALSKEQMTGYEISKGFTTAWGHFWQASHQQVYRELANLLDKGFVCYVDREQADKPDKKIYNLTDSGVKELNSWLETPCKEKQVNDALSIKFFAGEIIPPAILLKETNALDERSKHKLTIFLQIQQSVFKDIAQTDSIYAKYAYLSLRKGIIFQQANIAWCKEVLSILEEDILK